MAIFCRHCGNQVPDDSKFCPRCGQSPTGITPVAPDQATVPGYAQPVANTGPGYDNTYQGTPSQFTQSDYPASPQPPQQGAPQYAQNPQYPQPPQQGTPQYAQNPQYPQPPQQGVPQYPQSPQGVPFAPGVPPVKAAKKNRLPLFIVAAIIVVIAIVGGVTYFNFINQPSPAKTLSAFCNDLQAGNYSSAYSLLSNRFQKLATVAQWDTGLTSAFKAKGGISSCSTSNVSSGSTTATGNMLLNYGNNTKETDKVSLIDENSTWKVDNLVTQP